MEKGEKVHFKALQIGDYFSDSNGQKFGRITDRIVDLPNFPQNIINAFHIQSNCLISINPEDEVIFIRHSIEDFGENENQLFHSDRVSELDYQQDLFYDYLETLNSFLRRIEISNDTFDDEFYDHLEYNGFVNMIRSSFFISLYSFLETQLNNECLNAQKENSQIKISLSDLHGSGINRAKIYMEKVLDTSFSFNNDTNWNEIIFLNKLRNLIIHQEGQVKDTELLQQIESHQYLHLDNNSIEKRVILDEGFCEYVIIIVCGFLKSLEFHRQADSIS